MDFSLSETALQRRELIHAVAENMMRPISREFDENEHSDAWDFFNTMWEFSSASPADAQISGDAENKKKGPSERTLIAAIQIEELSWGDAGLYLSIPNPALGGAAVNAAGTPEQKKRFLGDFHSGKPRWAAMAITEPHFGSDSKQVATTAVRDGDEWVLNGTKIFCTSGKRALEDSDGFVVVWATLDASKGRAAIKSFIVPAGTPGVTVDKLEHKMGIRASDTAAIRLEDARIPADNLLGSADISDKGHEGFKGVMATFDATRPIVAASALGIAQAAIDFVTDALVEAGIEIRYEAGTREMTVLEKEVINMQSQLQAARLLTWRACNMMDRGERNSREASMCKSKAGLAVTLITQKAVELLGPLGYSRKNLLEKWMRDAKINDIFEGTQQINLMIVARSILGYSSKELN
ncbi:MAG TPA: acyl-CoA dehydrogenase [Deltaproteobacteria bacterium]|nr:acyl-CoA dehydrogenase [Candidatus Binatota bacterium]HIL12877.1 acyl-CoA dehydrogenase [Deltaproteobacteria bacterium]